ncbi:MAG: hypothetical protein IPF58_06230 [Saprospirales bacterium]|nr:hypothetical protein [Saprospirales bacterium]
MAKINLDKANMQTIIILAETKIDEYYVKFGLTFREQLKKNQLSSRTRTIKREEDSQSDLETKWIAQQMNDKATFIWNMKIAGRHYHLQLIELHWCLLRF